MIIPVQPQVKKAEGMCADIRCTNMLGPFDIKNNRRFCRNCTRENNVPQWKCAKCPNIITACTSRQTSKYCKKCQGYKEI